MKKYLSVLVSILLIMSLASVTAAEVNQSKEISADLILFREQTSFVSVDFFQLRKVMEDIGNKVEWDGQAAIITKYDSNTGQSIQWKVCPDSYIEKQVGFDTEIFCIDEYKPFFKDGRFYVSQETLKEVFNVNI